MHRYLADSELLQSGQLTLSRSEAHHLQSVLRIKPGEVVEFFDGYGSGRSYRVTTVARHGIELEAVSERCEHERPGFCLTLFVCVCKGRRMEWGVEKAVELGVSRIVPVVSQRSVVRLETSGSEGARVERWERVAEEAARQCGSYWLPEIMLPQSFERAVELVAGVTPTFVAALAPEAVSLQSAVSRYSVAPESAGWFVGPEGDFTPDELEQLKGAGGVPVSLGRLVLRSETAAVYGAAVLGSLWA